MAKLIKGSKAAKAFMAKIRAKKAPKKSAKKVSGVKESAKLKKELAAKKLRLPHGYETIKRTRKKKKLSGIHKDTKSHNVKISVMSGIKLSPDEKKFLELEGKKSKGFKYRAKILWGDYIVLKEKENGQPVQKFIVDSYDIADFLSKQLNKGQNLTKIKGKKIS
jgi:hypothetical protein